MFSARLLFRTFVLPVSPFKYVKPLVSYSFKSIHSTTHFIKTNPPVNAPLVANIQDIKDYLKKEIKNEITDKYTGFQPTIQLQTYYNDLIKQAQQKIALLDKCQDEDAMKSLFADEKFLDILDKYLDLNVYQSNDKTNPASWETIKAEISSYIARNQPAPKLGLRW